MKLTTSHIDRLFDIELCEPRIKTGYMPHHGALIAVLFIVVIIEMLGFQSASMPN